MESASSDSSDIDAEVDPRQEIRRYVKSVQTPGTFAYEFNPAAPAPNLAVQGIGSVALPLGEESVGALRGAAELAPFGHGAETKVDESVRKAWQIDGERIGLSAEFAEAIGKKYALHAAKKLGLRAEALGVEARLYKLVMYEKGGHFKPHKDTEKEVGMFGTLVVQLPTAQGHEGGALVVRHRKQKRVFAWQDPDGSYARGISAGGAASPPFLPVRCAAFYGDCEHELQPVTAGVRLCLLFNLVRTTPGPLPVAAVGQSGSAAHLRLSDAMAAWGRPGNSCGSEKFILPLEHEYTKASLSFGGLKGRDRAMADALRACREVDLYLATVVKHERGSVEPDYGYGGWGKRRRNGWYDDEEDGSESDADDKVMEEVFETDVSVENWVASDDNPVALRLNVDVESEVLDCNEGEDIEPDEEEAMELLFPFGVEPAEREYEGYTGNCSPTLDFWYHRAVLVLWPAAATMRTALRSGAGTALSVARQRSTRYGATDALPLADLDRIVSLAERTTQGHAFATDARHAELVLSLCAASGEAGLRSSRRFLRLLAGGVSAAVGTPGLRSEGVARGVAALASSVGWPAVVDDVTHLVKACDLEQAGNVAVLAHDLSSLAQQQQQQLASAVAAGAAASSAGALIASTCADGITSDLSALERVTARGATGIVRLLLVGLQSGDGNSNGTTQQLLSFANAGSSRLQTTVLAAAVHEFRIRLELSAASAGLPSPQHSSAVVILATALNERSFQGLEAAAVKTFAEDVLWLAARAGGAGGLEQGFAGAVLPGVRSGDRGRVREGQMQLNAVFKSKAVQDAVRGSGGGGHNEGAVFWRTLASERLGKVQAHDPPVFDWRQPNAVFGEHPQVQQFLRGPEKEMMYTRSGTFSNLQHARNFSYKYFTPSFSGPRNFSARSDPQGRGRNAYVIITKSKEVHQKRIRSYEEEKAEAAVLLGLLGDGAASSQGGGGSSGESRGDGPLPSAIGESHGAVARVAAAGNSRVREGSRAKVEVVDLCDSP